MWKTILTGSHILISAPRRVGKTSILFYLRDKPEPHYYFIYVITESIDNENDFFKRIYREIASSSSISLWEKLLISTNDKKRKILDKIRSLNFSGGGIELNKSEEPDYKEDLIELLESVHADEHLVIMVDEFPQTIENIIENEGVQAAKHFLQSNREIRQSNQMNNIQFVYTGSIGLENIVSQLNSMNLINDMNSITVPPLTFDDAELFISILLDGMDFTMGQSQIIYLLEKIQWLIPFYIQMAVQEIDRLCLDDDIQEVINQTIDEAFERMIRKRNYFEHWQKRLRKGFKKQDYLFAETLLNTISENSVISSNEIINMAEKFKTRDSYKDILRALIYDGYIHNNDEPGKYRFNSPILKVWWYGGKYL